ncbi:MAG: hypothetical protein Q8N53_21165 [Longimicrobiales bacterium]|nr:hypothetical protein [Longimicrobiales bacterium]
MSELYVSLGCLLPFLLECVHVDRFLELRYIEDAMLNSSGSFVASRKARFISSVIVDDTLRSASGSKMHDLIGRGQCRVGTAGFT